MTAPPGYITYPSACLVGIPADGLPRDDAVEDDPGVLLGDHVERVPAAGPIPPRHHPDRVAHEPVDELGIDVGVEDALRDAGLEHAGPRPGDHVTLLDQVPEPGILEELRRDRKSVV